MSEHAVTVRADGQRTFHYTALTAGVIAAELHGQATHTEDAAWPYAPDDLRMIVAEQLADLPANHYATRIHHTRRPIRGDVIVHRRSGGPLPAHLARYLAGAPQRASRALPLRPVEELRDHLAGARHMQAVERAHPELVTTRSSPGCATTTKKTSSGSSPSSPGAASPRRRHHRAPRTRGPTTHPTARPGASSPAGCIPPHRRRHQHRPHLVSSREPPTPGPACRDGATFTARRRPRHQ
jgi:hypothetical protein